MRLIDADALMAVMYHEAFETDSDRQKWDSGCWIRYKMFEEHIANAPTVSEWIPVSEALPSKGQVVLAIGDKGTWDVGKFQGTAGWTDDERMWNWKKKTVKYVEYWMPKDAIPLPNREDGEA